MPTIDQVNQVLRTITDKTTCLYFDEKNRLCFHNPRGSFLVRVQSSGLWFSHGIRIRNQVFAWGGTTEQAVVQLVRWLEGKPHRPIHPCWDCWVSHGVGTPETIRLLEASDYDLETVCVFCGKPNQTDWWVSWGLAGPCCRDGKCRKESA